MKSLRIDPSILNNPALQQLPPREFRRAFLAAAAGETSIFSPFVIPDDGRLPATIWRKLRAIVFARDGYVCQYCGDSSGPFECDHITPLSRGGSNEIENLITACATCNHRKHAKTLREWKGFAI